MKRKPLLADVTPPFHGYLVRVRVLIVWAIKEHDTKTFVMVDADEGGRPWDYWAGQHLTFRFDTVADKPVVRSDSVKICRLCPTK